MTKGATLDGTLNIHLINGFVPAIGSTFDILNASSVSGVFRAVNGLAINGSEHFAVTYSGNRVTLTVVAGPAGTADGISVTQSSRPDPFDRVRRGAAGVGATVPRTASALAPAAAPARTNFAFRNPMRFECGVNVNALLKTSPKRLLKGLLAASDSPDAVTVGYMSYTASHQPR